MKELVHKRVISIRTFDLGDHFILVKGNLIDRQHRAWRNEVQEQPKIVHHMVIQLKVKGPEMLIEQAGATMSHHPREECLVVLPSIRNLEGLRITQGFILKVKKAIGGTKGCAHLTSLITAMGPSAVQGYWAAYGVEEEKITLRDQAVRNMVNTCYLWREDGPLVKGLKEDG
ncbi:MAG: DUF2889 domain-containing protein [Thermodesulfobacteriota bacterium]|jgi:hypothetical protein